MRRRIDPAHVTCVLTSCGRFDLLERTVDSFLRRFDVDKIVVAEDSTRAQEAMEFARRFPQVEMRVNPTRLGQMRSIDALYETISTPYVVHLEDDWEFGSSVDLEVGIRFLESRPDVSCLVLANGPYNPKFERFAAPISFEGVGMKLWALEAHPQWFSYTFNPTLTRMSLWREHGPFASYANEAGFSAKMKSLGKSVAMLSPPIGAHIGDEAHVDDPFQARRPRNLWQRLARSVRKRWPGGAGGR
jgi:hypothetical protein